MFANAAAGSAKNIVPIAADGDVETLRREGVDLGIATLVASVAHSRSRSQTSSAFDHPRRQVHACRVPHRGQASRVPRRLAASAADVQDAIVPADVQKTPQRRVVQLEFGIVVHVAGSGTAEIPTLVLHAMSASQDRLMRASPLLPRSAASPAGENGTASTTAPVRCLDRRRSAGRSAHALGEGGESPRKVRRAADARQTRSSALRTT